MSDRLAYTPKQAAEAVGMSEDTIKRAIKRETEPRLRAKKHGRLYVIPADALHDWLDRLDDT